MREDDTKALMGLVGLYQIVLAFNGIGKEEFDGRWKSFQVQECNRRTRVRISVNFIVQ